METVIDLKGDNISHRQILLYRFMRYRSMKYSKILLAKIKYPAYIKMSSVSQLCDKSCGAIEFDQQKWISQIKHCKNENPFKTGGNHFMKIAELTSWCCRWIPGIRCRNGSSQKFWCRFYSPCISERSFYPWHLSIPFWQHHRIAEKLFSVHYQTCWILLIFYKYLLIFWLHVDVCVYACRCVCIGTEVLMPVGQC